MMSFVFIVYCIVAGWVICRHIVPQFEFLDAYPTLSGCCLGMMSGWLWYLAFGRPF